MNRHRRFRTLSKRNPRMFSELSRYHLVIFSGACGTFSAEVISSPADPRRILLCDGSSSAVSGKRFPSRICRRFRPSLQGVFRCLPVIACGGAEGDHGFPVKSLLLTKLFIGHAASLHHRRAIPEQNQTSYSLQSGNFPWKPVRYPVKMHLS